MLPEASRPSRKAPHARLTMRATQGIRKLPILHPAVPVELPQHLPINTSIGLFVGLTACPAPIQGTIVELQAQLEQRDLVIQGLMQDRGLLVEQQNRVRG